VADESNPNNAQLIASGGLAAASTAHSPQIAPAAGSPCTGLGSVACPCPRQGGSTPNSKLLQRERESSAAKHPQTTLRSDEIKLPAAVILEVSVILCSSHFADACAQLFRASRSLMPWQIKATPQRDTISWILLLCPDAEHLAVVYPPQRLERCAVSSAKLSRGTHVPFLGVSEVKSVRRGSVHECLKSRRTGSCTARCSAESKRRVEVSDKLSPHKPVPHGSSEPSSSPGSTSKRMPRD
jgi:hypothetical protein